MERLEWQESYSVGIQEIDDQHKELIKIINDLQEALELDKDSESIAKILEAVVDYTHHHFAYEEKLLEKHGYPDLEEHKKLHVEYRNKMADLKEQFESSRMFFKPKLVKEILLWLRRHILQVDMEYSRYLKKENII